MGKTTISWTNFTFNCWWGCTKVSAGCDHCYAETLAKRYGENVWGPGAPRRTFGVKHWNEPLKWNRLAEQAGVRARVFCGSMCDIMDVEAPDTEREKLWALIEATPWLHWQLLTKRPNLILRYMPEHWKIAPPANVWWGTSVEDEQVLWRIDKLVEVPAAVRFLSVEPMIGPVTMSEGQDICDRCGEEFGDAGIENSNGFNCTCQHCGNNTYVVEGSQWAGIHWVIYGGESGPGARPMQAEWLQNGIKQCRGADVACFVKQMGSVLAKEMGLPGKGDDPSLWPEWAQVQEFPAVAL